MTANGSTTPARIHQPEQLIPNYSHCRWSLAATVARDKNTTTTMCCIKEINCTSFPERKRTETRWIAREDWIIDVKKVAGLARLLLQSLLRAVWEGWGAHGKRVRQHWGPNSINTFTPFPLCRLAAVGLVDCWRHFGFGEMVYCSKWGGAIRDMMGLLKTKYGTLWDS